MTLPLPHFSFGDARASAIQPNSERRHCPSPSIECAAGCAYPRMNCIIRDRGPRHEPPARSGTISRTASEVAVGGTQSGLNPYVNDDLNFREAAVHSRAAGLSPARSFRRE